MADSFSILEKTKLPVVPLQLVAASDYENWRKKQLPSTQRWLEANQFTAAAGSFCLIPGKGGALEAVACGIDETPSLWSIAHLPGKLPAGVYQLESEVSLALANELALGWALGSYQFAEFRQSRKKFAQLLVRRGMNMPMLRTFAESIFWARDLINRPANILTPQTLAEEAVAFGEKHKAKIRVIEGEALLKANYPMIYTVGKASETPPRLVEMRFARKGAPKVALVGKAVTFDSGGLDIKTASGMKMMKKDMGGAASILALARMIVETGLKVDLRVLLPMVENAVGGNAMRPLDIVKTRKGITVEIGNTDAEGRLILCDALYEADSENPDLLIDFATLTGAARVALGTDIPAFFTPNDALADALSRHSRQAHDPLWRLPLWAGYRGMLETQNADLSNDPESSYAGAITAALYLQEFVSKTPSWLHVDMMAWNNSAKPGRPQGGEAMAVRAVYALLRDYYG